MRMLIALISLGISTFNNNVLNQIKMGKVKETFQNINVDSKKDLHEVVSWINTNFTSNHFRSTTCTPTKTSVDLHLYLISIHFVKINIGLMCSLLQN
jgi:hypothetical protein